MSARSPDVSCRTAVGSAFGSTRRSCPEDSWTCASSYVVLLVSAVHARAPPNVWGVCVGHNTGRGHPLVISANAVHVPMAQFSSLLINGVDVRALDQARPMFDALHAAQLETLHAVGIDTRAIKNPSCPTNTTYHGAQVAWSWLRAHEAIVSKFLGSGRRVMPQQCLSRVEMKLKVKPMGIVANGASAAVASAVAMVAHLWGRNVSTRYCVTGSLDLRVRDASYTMHTVVIESDWLRRVTRTVLPACACRDG